MTNLQPDNPPHMISEQSAGAADLAALGLLAQSVAFRLDYTDPAILFTNHSAPSAGAADLTAHWRSYESHPSHPSHTGVLPDGGYYNPWSRPTWMPIDVTFFFDQVVVFLRSSCELKKDLKVLHFKSMLANLDRRHPSASLDACGAQDSIRLVLKAAPGGSHLEYRASPAFTSG